MGATVTRSGAHGGGFRHEALLYDGRDAFLEGTVPFVRAGLAADEPVLAALSFPQSAWLTAALGPDAERVGFTDMARLGGNPARILPAWRDFVTRHEASGRPVRGIGEPVWPGRTHAELSECHRHEALLNLAFADTPRFWLLCPYDAGALAPAVVEEVAATHPVVLESGVRRDSTRYGGPAAAAAPFAEPLPAPVPGAGLTQVAFDATSLAPLRRLVAAVGVAAGLGRTRTDDLVLAVTEIATNSVRHGGGRGRLQIWQEEDVLLCDVRDEGRIAPPLAGRVRPLPGQVGGYGLWLANQLCELVQVRTFPTGNVVRLHMRLSA